MGVWKNWKDMGVAEVNCLNIYEGTWQVISTLDSPFLSFMTNVHGNPNQSMEEWENSAPL